MILEGQVSAVFLSLGEQLEYTATHAMVGISMHARAKMQ